MLHTILQKYLCEPDYCYIPFLTYRVCMTRFSKLDLWSKIYWICFCIGIWRFRKCKACLHETQIVPKWSPGKAWKDRPTQTQCWISCWTLIKLFQFISFLWFSQLIMTSS
ncbi:hypothetical protein O6H91_24G004500 [Diphasiastrum complanatum]|uniref:Uncharacterized protein n=1 Tax=Diphasiastrum complanatum TaxID=34168 RepID=A0ACC2A7I1_DIPCM|nr:hypothetical protein O6H91_24G004500 [Diphasiastrum complanatum]